LPEGVIQLSKLNQNEISIIFNVLQDLRGNYITI